MLPGLEGCSFSCQKQQSETFSLKTKWSKRELNYIQFSVNSCQIDNAPKITSCSKVVGISPFEQFLFSLKGMWVLVTEPCLPPLPPNICHRTGLGPA